MKDLVKKFDDAKRRLHKLKMFRDLNNLEAAAKKKEAAIEEDDSGKVIDGISIASDDIDGQLE